MQRLLSIVIVGAGLIGLALLACNDTGTESGVTGDGGGTTPDAKSGSDAGGSDAATEDSSIDAATGDDVGSPDDAGTVADGSQDAETDTGADTGTTDDAAQDAGTDAGVDAGPSWWRPAAGTSWQIQLQGTLSTNVDVEVYDIDLFDTDQSVINKLKADGRKVICYFSAGSYEDWRPDKAKFQKSDYGKPLDNWPGEWWLDVRSQNVRIIMADRMDIAVQKKCDAVDPDNVDGYQNDTGFPLTAADQQDYLEFLADAAHARGLAVGLKNCLGLVTKVVSRFEFQVNEECLAYNECRDLKPFINADKPVFHIEYVNQTSEGPARKAEVCGDPTIAGFSTLIKTWDLDAWRLTCD